MENVLRRIEKTGLVPVVVLNDENKAVPTAKAMLAGGVDVMEITLRTPQGLESIRRVSEECLEMLVGGGTVVTMEQCKAAIANGARFIVSPGFDEEIVRYCIDRAVLPCPGCVTPTEITAALKTGIRVLKFFPANIYGGLTAIKALRGPFNMVRFVPTGGINVKNLAEYRDPAIVAAGGGWLCETKLIDEERYNEITEICKQSVSIWNA